MRQAAGFRRQAEAGRSSQSVRIRIMATRRESRFPLFWQLQTAGWAGFYLLVLVAAFPSLKQAGALWGITWFVASMFVASFPLRLVCRSLARRSLPWLGLEVRAFLWSILAGAIATLIADLVTLGTEKIEWTSWLGDFVQSAVVLFLWCSLYLSIKHWQQAAQERERLLRAESEARAARLTALRYQLNPHFLFNALNAVSTLVLEGNAARATRMLSQIGEFLRTALDNEVAPETPLSQELAFTERYLAIEQTRLGARLRVEMGISPETLDALVPSMLLQPLLENAVRHGIAPLVEGGTIAIRSQVHDGHFQIIVKNSGATNSRPAQQPPKSEDGVGLANVAERLRVLYGADHRFSLEWPDSGGCVVFVELPFRTAEPGRGALVCGH